MYTLGVDIGSSSTKAVILKNGDCLIASSVIHYGTGTTGAEKILEDIIQKSKIGVEEIAHIISTGYGRERFSSANRSISELTCHAKGVCMLLPQTRTIIDIGGQDVKVIRVDEKGAMVNFMMNDKCAAGTGRFLEVMAKVLETDVAKLSGLALLSKKRLDISSTCTVFAESEVISHLSNGESIPDVVAGIHRSVIKNVCGLAMRVGILPPLVMTGGVAQNSGVVSAMQELLKVPIAVPSMPQLTGALGAARLGYEELVRAN